MGVSYIVSEIKRYSGRNCDLSYFFYNNLSGENSCKYFALFFSQPALSGGGNTFCKMSSVYSHLKRVIDRQTNRRKSDLNSEAYYVTLVKSLLVPRGRECLCLASKSNFGLL